MADDDLSAPLGKESKKRRFALPITIPQVIAGVLGLFILTFAAWALFVDDPLGGEPVSVVATTMPPAVKPAEPQKPAATGPKPAMPTMPTPDGPRPFSPVPGQTQIQPPATTPSAIPPGSQTVTIIDGSTGKRQEVAISGSQDARAPVEQRLLEPSRHGPIPRVGPDGARPADVYARPVTPNTNRTDAPRVAIVITGLGTSNAATQDAIAKLPAPVTFAFAPYANEVANAVARARSEGHEILLQVPMEPFDYPDNDPGPQTLLMGLGSDQNMDRLYWLMSRFQGYVGLMNFMGARFTSSEQALAPVLREGGKRGLIYLDDGSSPRSLAGQIASNNNLTFAKSEISLDAVPNPVNIDRALNRLEAMARERGTAVGVATALPASIDRISKWAKGLETRGIMLVPISMIANKPKSS